MFKLVLLLVLVVVSNAMPRVDRVRRSPHHHHHGIEIGSSLGFGQSDLFLGGYDRYPPVGYLTYPGGYGGYGGYGGWPNSYETSYGGGYGGGHYNSFDIGFDLWR